MKYINDFAIDEDNQFEIVAIHDTECEVKEKIEIAMQAVAKLTQQNKEGPEYFKIFDNFTLKICISWISLLGVILVCQIFLR